MTFPILSIDALVRSIGINKQVPHSIFLGAGASISSGIPSAAACIWEWKRTIFVTGNPGMEAQFQELSLPSVKHRIQEWLDSQRKFPAIGASGEYGFYINACYPLQGDRRSFFARYLEQARPSSGYQLLALMARAGTISSVWTTNFDALSARSATGANVPVIEVGIDSQARVDRVPRPGELLSVALHGDYRYDDLKNEPQEIRNQEQHLIDAMTDAFTRTPVIVCGYRGRDSAIVDALSRILATDSNAPFYWCSYSDEPPSPELERLLSTTNSKGHYRGAYVTGVEFDDLLRRLTLHCLEGEHANSAKAILEKVEKDESRHISAFALPNLPITGLIKSNAFQLTPPNEMLQFDLKEWPKEKVWAHLQELGDKHGFVAAPLKGKVLAFATAQILRNAFGDNLKGAIERVPVGKDDLKYEDTVTITLIRRALVRAAARRAGLPYEGAMIWASDAPKNRQHNRAHYLAYEAVVLYVRPFNDGIQLILMPTIHITNHDGTQTPIDLAREAKNAILGYQHNAKFNEAVERWRKVFLPKDSDDFHFPPADDGFRFHVMRVPFFGAIMDQRENAVRLAEKTEKLVSYRGLQIREPSLVFACARQQKIAQDIHPVRGLLQNRPYDIDLTTKGLAGTIRVGVVCPSQDRKVVATYLQLLNRPLDPSKKEDDYLPAFPGFAEAFRTTITMPSPGDAAWFDCPEPDAALDERNGALELGRVLAAAIAQLRAAQVLNVIVIYIPARWGRWRVFSNDDESFNLHDFVKASAIPLGIATQFLEADTLKNELQCRIRWWLSLAFYVKSMRTPWVLSGLQQDTAYVGLAFGMARQNRDHGNIVLGCSHLYNAQGEGLQFRLSKIENPIFLGRNRRNPYMSSEDARRLGETIRQQFFEARLCLPKRVVIHKLTPFLQQEQLGLRSGLEGVDNIELIQIFTDDALRYVASTYKDEAFAADGFPIRRGTILLQDGQSALLWIHGVSTALNERRKYYQGKRRIPAPMVIRRFSAHAPLDDVAGEILGLSKMNWNSFDLYAQIPATIESSRQVARIGSLLTRFGASYDYRLFM